MDVVIVGGHGKVARQLARLLVAGGDRVRGVIRNPAHVDDLRADGSEPVVCDLERVGADELARAISGADAVAFAAGAGPGSGAERKLTVDRDGAIKLLHAASAAHVERYVMVSSVGAEDPPDGDDVFAVYLRAKAEADRELMASDRAWTVVRPVFLQDEQEPAWFAWPSSRSAARFRATTSPACSPPSSTSRGRPGACST
jgi:uncharacterized protein YbjT (DUF2867 family)